MSKPMNIKSLSKDLLVAREIYIAEKDGDTPVYFNKLVHRLEQKGLASRGTVSKAIDALIDGGIVKANWKRLPDRHVRALSVAGEVEAIIAKLVTDYVE